MHKYDVINIIEACLLASKKPLQLAEIAKMFDDTISLDDLQQHIEELTNKYATHAIELVQVDQGYRFRTRPEIQPYLAKMSEEKPAKYSRATMETLATIAYRQPITRGEIENLRGVTINSNTIQLLLERGWIEVVGYKEVPGKPELLATTSQFLNDLSLDSLAQLPKLSLSDE